MKIIITILGILLLTTLVGAVEIIAGDSYSFESEQFEYYDIVGNHSDMQGMNVSWENGNTTLSFDVNYAPDNFTIILFNQETEVIVEHHYSSGGGGGGGGTRTIYKNKTEYRDKIIYKDKIIETEVEVEKEVIKDTRYRDAITSVIVILLFLLAIYLLFSGYRNTSRNQMEEIDNKEETKKWE